MSALAVLTNPASGRNRDRRELDRVRAAAREAGAVWMESDDPAHLPGVLADLAGREVDVLAINGGDGTVVAVVTELLRGRPFARLPVLAVLAGGTTNMIAGDVGVPGRPAAAVRRLARAAGREGLQMSLSERRPLRVRQAGQAERYGFFLSTAAAPRVLQAAQQQLHGRGLTGAAGWVLALSWSFLRLAAGRIEHDPLLHPDPVALGLDTDPPAERPAVVVLATTLQRLLLGMTPAPPGNGVGVAAIYWPYRKLWRRLPGLLRGRGGDWTAEGYLRTRAQRVRLQTPAACVLDGEPLDGDATVSLELDCGPVVTFARV